MMISFFVLNMPIISNHLQFIPKKKSLFENKPSCSPTSLEAVRACLEKFFNGFNAVPTRMIFHIEFLSDSNNTMKCIAAKMASVNLYLLLYRSMNTSLRPGR